MPDFFPSSRFGLLDQTVERLPAMGDSIDLTGDGGVTKTIVRHAKAEAIAPTEDLPLVDGKLIVVFERVLLIKDIIFQDSYLLSWKNPLICSNDELMAVMNLFLVSVVQFIMKALLLKLVTSSTLHVKTTPFSLLSLERGL